jgi:PhoH-like ATPase
MAKRKYVIDTSVFLTDHRSIVRFGAHDIIIPLKVLEEIDKHKKRQDVVGSNARNIVRFLDKLRESGTLQQGVSLGEGKGTVYAKGYDSGFIPAELDKKNADHIIIATALTERASSEEDVVLVTRDIQLRVMNLIKLSSMSANFMKVLSSFRFQKAILKIFITNKTYI